MGWLQYQECSSSKTNGIIRGVDIYIYLFVPLCLLLLLADIFALQNNFSRHSICAYFVKIKEVFSRATSTQLHVQSL